VVYFMMNSVSRTTYHGMVGWCVMNLKKFWRKQPLPNLGTILIFASRDWGRTWKPHSTLVSWQVSVKTKHILNMYCGSVALPLNKCAQNVGCMLMLGMAPCIFMTLLVSRLCSVGWWTINEFGTVGGGWGWYGSHRGALMPIGGPY
jgi:hypothetical protein